MAGCFAYVLAHVVRHASHRVCCQNNFVMCSELDIIEAPLFDLEVRGVPALQYFGSRVWDSPQEH